MYKVYFIMNIPYGVFEDSCSYAEHDFNKIYIYSEFNVLKN